MSDRFALISELIAEPALAGRSGDVAQAVLRAESLADLPPWLLGVIIDRERYPGQPRDEKGQFASGNGNAGGSDDTPPFVLPGNIPGTPTYHPPKPLDWRKSETYAKVSAGVLRDKSPDPREGDPLLVSLAHEVGADGPPTLVTREEMDRIVASGSTPYFRGVIHAEYATQLRSGEYHGGLGLRGSGYYFTEVSSVAGMYAELRDQPGEGEVIRAALKPDARVIRHEDLYDTDLYSDNDKAIAKNIGRWALVHGYDAIDFGRDTIVVNRTALVVQVADAEFDREMERLVQRAVRYPGQPRDELGRFSESGGGGFAEMAQQAIASALGGETLSWRTASKDLSALDSERLTQAFADEVHAQGDRLAPVFSAASVSYAGKQLLRQIQTIDDAILAGMWAKDLSQSVDGLVRVAEGNQPEAARVAEVHFGGAGVPGMWPMSAQMGTIAYVEGRQPGGDFSDEWVLNASPNMDFRINVNLGMGDQIAKGIDTGWFMKGLDYEGISAHEFGHLFHASGGGLAGSSSPTTFSFIRAEANGVRVSQYAYKNREEQWAELFASKYVLPKDEQPPVVADGRLDRFIASLHETGTAPSRAVRYAEDQPRDDHGRFSAGGVGQRVDLVATGIAAKCLDDDSYWLWDRQRGEAGDITKGNAFMADIARARGIDGPPSLASGPEIEALAAEGWVVGWRGAESEAAAEQFRSGPVRYGPGSFGRGYYLVEGDTGSVSEAAYYEASAYARTKHTPYGPDEYGPVVRVAISPDAKIIDYNDAVMALPPRGADPERKFANETDLAAWQATNTDVGNWALVNGYDAIRATSTMDDRASDRYLVLLNRSIAVVQRDDSRPGEPNVQRQPATRYSEDQPRVPAGSPEGGEFAANETAGDSIGDLSPAKRAKVTAQVDALRSQFPALRGVRVLMVDADPQGRRDVLAYADQNTQTINLIRSAWSVRNPGGLRGSEWNAVPGIEGTIAHEVGHLVAGHLASPGPGVKYDIAANDLMERLNARAQEDWVSSYGSMGDPGENWAEWFSAAMVEGNRKYDAPQAVEIRAALAGAGFYKPPASRSARYAEGQPRAAEWDPSLHPRDNAGKFADAGGGLNTVSPEWMKRYDAPLRALSDGEQHALDYYGTFKYSLVNGYLRNGVVPDRWVLFNGFERATEDADRRRVPEIVGQIHGAIEQMPPTDRDVTVVRQFNARQFGHIEDGDVVVDKGFVSTAIDPAHAKSAAPGDLPALAYITLPKGTRASPIDIFGPTELVLDYGALFRVDHVDRDKSGYPTRWLMTYTGSNPEQQGSAPMATRQPPSTQAGRFLWGSGDLIVTSPVARVPSVLRYPGQPRDDHGRWSAQSGTILDPLRAEAAKYPTFDAFSRAYQVEIKHGLYWHVTADKDFVVDPTKGPRDMSTAGTGSEVAGKLMVTSDLDRWLAEYPAKERPYVARIDLSAVAPEDYRAVSRGFGNEFMVSDPSKAEVVGTYSRSRAKAIDREYDAALPQNEEQLRAVWEVAHQAPKHTRYPGQPRDKLGQFAGYGTEWEQYFEGALQNPPEIREAAKVWSNGWASDMRNLLLVGDVDPAYYGARGDESDHNLLDEAKVLVRGVNDSLPTQYRLFRGLGLTRWDFRKFGEEVDVGKTIDLNLSAWTRSKSVATQFASNSFGTAIGHDEYGTPLMVPHQVILRLEPGAQALDVSYDIVQGPEYTEHLSLGRYEVVAIERTEGPGQMPHDGSYQESERWTRDIVTLRQVGTLDEDSLRRSNARQVRMASVVGKARLIPWLEKLLDARMVPPDPGDRGPEKRVVDAHGNVHDDLGRFSEKGGYGADPFGGRSDAAMGRVEYARTLEIAKAARAWPDTQPWNATRDDIAAGRVPFFVVKDLSPGTIAMAALGEIWVNIDQWDQREPKERAVVLYHELGHFALASAEIEPAISAEIIGLSGRTPLPASAWGSLAGSIDPVGETLADIYADVATSEPGIDQDGSGVKVPGLPGRWVTDERAVKLWATVESEARFNGFPGGTQVLLWPRQQLPDRATRVVDALGNIHDELGRFSEKDGGAASGPDFWYPWSEDHDWAKGHEVGDFPATAYARHVGFDAPSHSASTEEMDRLIDGGAKAMYRGVDNERYLSVLHDGFYRASFGIYGSGIYTTTSNSEAAGYGSRFTQESWVARMVLTPDAKVVVHADLRREMEEAKVAFDAETAANDHLNDFEKKIYKVDTLDEYRAAEKGPTGYQSGRDKIRDVVFANEGIFAMAHGYDAIDLSENARTSLRDRADIAASTAYTIVLNRGALIVENDAAHYKVGKVVDGPNWRSVQTRVIDAHGNVHDDRTGEFTEKSGLSIDDAKRIERAKEPPSPGPFYHGTNVDLRTDDPVLPASRVGYDRSRKYETYDPKVIYLTDQIHLAERYAVAKAGREGGTPHVYEVNPVGEVRRDPEYIQTGWGKDQHVADLALVKEELPLPGLSVWNPESNNLGRPARAVSRYSEDQPRDDYGRFAESGSSSYGTLDAINAAEEAFPNAVVDIREGWDPKHLSEAMAGLDEMASLYPDVAKSVTSVRVYGMADMGDYNREYMAEVRGARTRDPGNLLLINSEYLSEKGADALVKNEATGWTPRGGDDWRYVAIHEFAHLLANTDRGVIAFTFALHEKPENRQDFVAPSRYAWQNADECWAELFASVYVTPEDEWSPSVRETAKYLDSYRAGEIEPVAPAKTRRYPGQPRDEKGQFASGGGVALDAAHAAGQVFPRAIIDIHGGFDPKYLSEAMDGIDEMASLYPDVAGDVTRFTVGRFDYGPFEEVEYEARVSGVRSDEDGNRLEFNSKFLNEGGASELALNEATGFSPRGGDDWRYIAIHEFGHLFANKEEQVIDFTHGLMRDENGAERADFKGPSIYASENVDECWAELFASVYVTPEDQWTPAVRATAKFLDSYEPGAWGGAAPVIRYPGQPRDDQGQWTADGSSQKDGGASSDVDLGGAIRVWTSLKGAQLVRDSLTKGETTEVGAKLLEAIKAAPPTTKDLYRGIDMPRGAASRLFGPPTKAPDKSPYPDSFYDENGDALPNREEQIEPRWWKQWGDPPEERIVALNLSGWTSNQSTAEHFASFGGRGVPVNLILDAGAKAVSIEGDSFFGEEQEWLTAGHFKVGLHVKEYGYNKDGKYGPTGGSRIYLTQVDVFDSPEDAVGSRSVAVRYNQHHDELGRFAHADALAAYENATVNLDGMLPEFRSDFTHGLSRIASLFPDTARYLTRIAVVPPSEVKSGRTWLGTTRMIPYGILLNADPVADPDTALHIGYAARTGFHTPATHGYYDIAIHEFAHCLQNIAPSPFYSVSEQTMTFRETVQGPNGPVDLHDFWEPSKYCGVNGNEAFAEQVLDTIQRMDAGVTRDNMPWQNRIMYDALMKQSEAEKAAVEDHDLSVVDGHYIATRVIDINGMLHDALGKFAKKGIEGFLEPDYEHSAEGRLKMSLLSWTSDGEHANVRAALSGTVPPPHFMAGADEAARAKLWAGRVGQYREDGNTLLRSAADAPPTNRLLFRGIAPSDADMEQLRDLGKGDIIPMNICSWSSDASAAISYAAPSWDAPNHVVFQLLDGARALDVPDSDDWLAAGLFRIVHATEQTTGVLTIGLQQIEAFDSASETIGSRKAMPMSAVAGLWAWLEHYLGGNALDPEKALPASSATGERAPREYVRDRLGRFAEVGDSVQAKYIDDPAKVIVEMPELPYERSVNEGDIHLDAICEIQGFNGPPDRITREELDQHVAAGEIHWFRGVAPGTTESGAYIMADDIAEQYASGGPIRQGTGWHGNGTYVAVGPGFIWNGKEITALESAAIFADPGVVFEGTIKVGARIIDYETLMRMPLPPSTEDPVVLKWHKIPWANDPGGDSPETLLEDPGRKAAALGYDAIYAPISDRGPNNRGDMYVILNRTVLRIADGLYEWTDPTLSVPVLQPSSRYPGQPRDELGQWTSGGAIADSPEDVRKAVRAWVGYMHDDDLNWPYVVDSHCEVRAALAGSGPPSKSNEPGFYHSHWTEKNWNTNKDGYLRAGEILLRNAADAPPTTAPLWRGILVDNLDAVRLQSLEVGEIVPMNLCGWSSDQAAAVKYTNKDVSKPDEADLTTRVVFQLAPGAHALDVSDQTPSKLAWEKESLAAGRFQVYSVKMEQQKSDRDYASEDDAPRYLLIGLRQIEAFDSAAQTVGTRKPMKRGPVAGLWPWLEAYLDERSVEPPVPRAGSREVRFNPYHDEKGKFTHGPGGGDAIEAVRSPMPDLDEYLASVTAIQAEWKNAGTMNDAEKQDLRARTGALMHPDIPLGPLASAPPLTSADIDRISADPELMRGVVGERYGIAYLECTINRNVLDTKDADGKWIIGDPEYLLTNPPVAPWMRAEMLKGLELIHAEAPAALDRIEDIGWGKCPSKTALGQNVLGGLYMATEHLAAIGEEVDQQFASNGLGTSVRDVIVHEVGHSFLGDAGWVKPTAEARAAADLARYFDLIPTPPVAPGLKSDDWRVHVQAQLEWEQERVAKQGKSYNWNDTAIAQYTAWLGDPKTELKVSNYAGINSGEFLAENFRMYITQPDKMRETYPGQYAMMARWNSEFGARP